ncbi:MAG: sigma-70 family RNA polymerase sigma factor [Lentisphaeria bacterium]|nr:sigma-70 family RNA polymerase sigma factor [Lentisphaeria bacterium]
MEQTASDAELVSRSLDGDESGFRAIVERYQRDMFACAYAVLHNASDASDAVQDGFIRFHRHLVQYDPRRPLRPYLVRIASNCARNIARTRRPTVEITDNDTALDRDSAPSPRAAVLGTERRGVVRQFVGRLPRTLREVCSLYYLAEMSCREVAGSLSMTETAVKVALHRARKRLLADGLAEWRTTSP